MLNGDSIIDHCFRNLSRSGVFLFFPSLKVELKEYSSSIKGVYGRPLGVEIFAMDFVFGSNPSERYFVYWDIYRLRRYLSSNPQVIYELELNDGNIDGIIYGKV